MINDGVQQQVVSGEQQQQQHSDAIARETGLLEQIDVVELSRLPMYAAKKAYFERGAAQVTGQGFAVASATKAL